MKKNLLSLLWPCVFLFASSQWAESAVFVTISANGESVTCDNGSGLTFSKCRASGFVTFLNSSVITFSGSVGGYQFIDLTVISNVSGDALAFVTQSSTGVTHTSGSGDLTVDFGAYNYTLPTGPTLFLSASGTATWTISQPGDRVFPLQGSARADNLPIVPFGNATTTLAPLNSSSSPATASSVAGHGPPIAFIRLTTPFAVTGHAVIHQAIGSIASYQSTIVVQ